MPFERLFPWLVTAAAVGVAAIAWWAPHTPTATVASEVESTESAPSPPPFDPRHLEQAVVTAVRAELAHATPTASAPAPSPEAPPPSEAQVAEWDVALSEGLEAIDSFVAAGRATQEDKYALREVLGRLDQERSEELLHTYFQALNRGEIVVDGAPL